MNTAHKCCYVLTESQFSMRTVSNYCALLFFVLALTASRGFIQSASAQTPPPPEPPSGTLLLVGPSRDPSPNEEFVVSVEIVNPQNVLVFGMTIEYSADLSLSYPNPIQPGEDQFDILYLSIGGRSGEVNGRVQRVLNLNNSPGDFSEGTLFTVKFKTLQTGNHQVGIHEARLYERTLENELAFGENDIPSLNVPVRGPIAGTVHLVPSVGTKRVGEAGFIDVELKDRSRAHRYEITVDPSENLGALTVSYNSDDTDGTAIINHNAGDSITIGANLWLPNDPIDNVIDWRVTHSDPIVATLFFTPTTAGEGSFEITEAKIFDSDDTGLTLSNPDPLTLTITGARRQVSGRNTGTGPTPIITVDDGTKQGPFEIGIHFESKNYIEHVVNADAAIWVQRGIYGFARDEIEVGGDAGASVTTRLWAADGAQIYYARINPTETGEREVTIQIPAGVIHEVGTNLPNVVSETVTVNVNLTNPPWDVDNNGSVQEADAEFVEAALGQGIEDRHNFALYVNTIEDRRTDVNGDLYVNQVDVDLVRMHISADDGGVQGRSDEVSGQAGGTGQARSIAPPPDASVWMPDDNLRKEIRKKFGIRNDDDLTQARMTHLTSLGFRSDKIADITGLEYAVNLTALVIRKTQVSDLTPLKDLTSLRSLKVVDSDVSNVTALGGLTDLTFLNVSGNTISDVTALGNLTNLTELWATDNNISNITALASLTKLRKLRLRDNLILDTSPIYPLTRNVLTSVDISVSEYPPWDVNEDGSVDATDSALVTAALGQSGNAIVDPRTDVDGDGTVDNADLTLVTKNLDANGGAPSSVDLSRLLDRETLENLDRGVLEIYLNALRAESDGSLKYQRAIALLERVLAAMRPTETLLLANYPNPFNPETWIPYHLSELSDVRIIIYDTHGRVVRRLDLGHQPEGYYTGLSRAAHWDGLNDTGERVASGVYFYQLQTDNTSHLRKMVILK